MNRWTLLTAAVLLAVSTQVVSAQVGPTAAPVAVKLWRLDCGVIQVDDLNEYSDTYAFGGKSKRFSAGCYLIKHGDTYMLWDTGLSEADLGLPLQGPGSTGESLTVSLREIARNLRAAVVIQHEEHDVGKLPKFPAFAE